MTGNASPVWLSYVGPELCSEPLVAFRLLSVAVLVGWAVRVLSILIGCWIESSTSPPPKSNLNLSRLSSLSFRQTLDLTHCHSSIRPASLLLYSSSSSSNSFGSQQARKSCRKKKQTSPNVAWSSSSSRQSPASTP